MTDRPRDPVCGMATDAAVSASAVYREQTFFFCSEYCKNAFLATPEHYAVAAEPAGTDHDPATRRVAYFSMEVGLDSALPIYSGGLGVLAGDTLRSFADLKVPAVGVSVLYAKGYFRQTLDALGNQHEHAVNWSPEGVARLLPSIERVSIANRSVAIRAWQYDVIGSGGFLVPLILLDTNFADNASPDRDFTCYLYGGDERYRLSQEIILGVGGVRMLRALGYKGIERFHMNEGHASLLALELLRKDPQPYGLARDMEEVKRRCVFTTHTPVAAGHDQFRYDLVEEVLGEPVPAGELRMLAGSEKLNMTLLGLNLSHYVNGVAKRHGEVSQRMFPGYPIDSITNGVHSFTWTCDSFRRLYDHHIPGWTRDSFSLRHAIKIPYEEIWEAHAEAKARLLEEIRRRTSRQLANDVLTLGFARRATSYKRADLLFRDSGRLLDISKRAGGLQIVFAGKAHPRDEPGKELIRQVFRLSKELGGDLPVVYLEDYDLDLARLLTSGTDVWLNTPRRPLEASGTSGMKAAVNGIPSLSVLDGWWVEGCIEGITGWSIERQGSETAQKPEVEDEEEASDLYRKLETVILPLYHEVRIGWIDVMRSAIALNASFFNTHRMVQQYVANAYL